MIHQIKPAGAKPRTLEKIVWDEPGWIAEEKWNGWRFLSHTGGGLDRGYLTGRRESSITGELSEKGLCAPCLWLKLPRGIGYTVIDGEVLPPGGASFHDIAGIMNVSPEEAARRIAEIGEPRYRAFDCLFFDGEDIREQPLYERRRRLQRVAEYHLGELFVEDPVDQDQQKFYEKIVFDGGEGVILKDLSASYGESGAWLKVKKFHDLDVIITGWKPGKGKYEGQIGAAIVSVYLPGGVLTEVGRVGGMTDEIREDMTDHPERWLGTVIEVRSQEFGREKLLHPRYRRARPDANPREATFEKLMLDLRVKIELPRTQLALL